MLLCIDCAGVHRSLGTHITKVRSLELDRREWTPPLLDLMESMGNSRSNTIWEARPPPLLAPRQVLPAVAMDTL